MSEFPETNQSLIARVRDSADAAAWAEFLGIYQPVVFRMARRRGLQDADAHDVMQQVFLSISRSIEDWTAGENQPPFRAWLTTVARNAITKALSRRPRDLATGSTSMIELLHSHPEPEATTVELQLDLFSLGSVMYAMSTGRPPFRAETTLAVLRRVGDTVPRSIREINAEIPDWLERIVVRLMAKDAADRFSTATEVATLLEQCLAHVQQPTSVPLPEACRVVSRGISGWKSFWSIVAVLLALVAIGMAANRQRVRPSLNIPKVESVSAVTDSDESDSLLRWNSTQQGLDATEDEINGLEAVMERELENAK